MDDLDPIAGSGYEMAEVFAHAPDEFELTPWGLSWDSPCWVNVDIILRPRSLATQEKFILNLRMPHHVDAFARVSWEDQLWAAFSPRLAQIAGSHSNDWFPQMMKCYQQLKEALKQKESIFPEPFRFVVRQEFVKVDLPTILKENPE